MTGPGASEVRRFRELLLRRLGWQFDDGKSAALADTLAVRAAAARQTPGGYLEQLTRPGTGEELATLARELTVTETYFNRYTNQFAALVQQALPERLACAGPARRLQLLSMGCASGEEPYSLAIAIREALPEAVGRVDIVAADINPAALERAGTARYSPWSLRELPAAAQQRWFRANGGAYQLDPEIVRAVEFQRLNLAEDAPAFWRPGRFDIVFCRNVLMYFETEQASRAVARIAQALDVGGYLFLGHAETLRGLSSDFHVCHCDGAFYYRRATGAQPQLARRSADGDGFAPLAGDLSWVQTIRMASERINRLSESSQAPGPQERVQPPDLAPVREHLQHERYGEALQVLEQLATDHGDDAELLLLRAAALCHSGALSQAEVSCRTLLQADECKAGAHYILALCCEARGDLAGAREHDQISAFLDPRFAMPRMHLGLLARRQGDVGLASRELDCAAKLLQDEDPARLLMFGGGFQRDVLIALCQAGIAPATVGER